MVKTVRITKNGTFSIAELQIFSGGVNVATTGTATAKNHAHGGKAPRAIDGNTNGNWRGGSVTHSNGSGWLEVTLPAQVPVEKIIVYDRNDCCHDRIKNATLELKDASGAVVANTTIPQFSVKNGKNDWEYDPN